MLELMPERWRLLDILVWRYDISFDPGRGKYKPLYEWVIRVGFGEVDLPEFGMLDWYIPILKGNSIERRELRHPAMFPRELVTQCLKESNRPADLVLDPFLGSGTTLAACLEAGVNSLGFELSPQFSTDISKRLEWVKWAGNGELKRA
jgi:DNA modification methylase